MTNDAIASELGVSHESVYEILHDDLNMYRVCINTCRDAIEITDADDRFLKKIVIGDVL